MKKILAVFFILSLAFASASFAHTPVSSKVPAHKKENGISFLFIDAADKGELVKNKDDSYTLTLLGADDWITFFSDVPHRITGIMTVDSFVELMNKEIHEKNKHGLNAGLIAVNINKEERKKIRYVLSLKNPIYNAKENTFTFTANTLPGEQKDIIPDNSKLQFISIFIDGLKLNEPLKSNKLAK